VTVVAIRECSAGQFRRPRVTGPDGGRVARHDDAPGAYRVDAARLARYVARKGSICVDGVSLTVNGVTGNRFDVNLVPHTLDVTILGGYRPGTRVNLEVDIIARYLERLLAASG
jgi:riboflavin synthase